jgi:molybdopterin/thiamine biosynthesis adenylyltransferase
VILTDTEAKPVSHDKIYSRHKIIPGWKQGLLENLRIFLCGLGGNGALVFDSLLALGIGSAGGWIRACDPDILEESNLPRIPYAYPWHVGLPKAVVAAEHARRKNLKLNTQCYGMALEDKQMIESIKQANLIIGAIDNDGARMTLNGLAARYGIPYIDLGTEIIPGDNRYEAIGQIRCFIPGKTGCLVCTGAIDPSNAALDSMSEEDRDDYQRAGYIRGEKETPTPSVLHLNGVVSHLAISQFLKMIFDDNFESSDYIHYDRQKSMLLAASSLRDDQCPVCGINGYIAQGDETGHELEELEEFKNNDVLTEKAQVVEKEDKQ